ncbi:MAG: SOS response-associated peptidase family protein [Edaphobacter sp.]
MAPPTASSCTQSVIVNCTANLAVVTAASPRRSSEGLSHVSWKLSRTVVRGAVGGNADCLLDQEAEKGKTKPKYEFVVRGHKPFGMAGVWKLWKTRRQAVGTNLWIPNGERNELMAPIHDHMTTFLLPKDYAEYLESTARPPVHLLRILSAEQVEATLAEITPISNRQVIREAAEHYVAVEQSSLKPEGKP